MRFSRQVGVWARRRLYRVGMSRRARIVVLVGPKGSGKTTLGRFFASEPGVHFLEVEAIAKRVLEEMGRIIDEEYARHAFDAIARETERISGQYRALVIETTGASEQTPRFLDALRLHHSLYLVRVRASVQTCARRIRERDPSRQVDVSAELIREMHERTEALNLDWDLELQNDPPLTRDRVVEALGGLLGSP